MQVNKKIKWYSFVLLILFSICPAYAADYFVDPNGNDTTGDGSIGNPWQTIPKAVTAASAGDTIYLRGGTHTYTTTITISKSGTAGARYYMFGYNSERPTLDFSSMSENSSNRGILLTGDYWYIKGIDIKGAGDNGMWMSSSNNIIEFCSFYENKDTGLQLNDGAANNQIINCDSYYNCDSDQGDADGFAPKLGVGSGNYFYGCRAWQNSDDAYDGYMRENDDVTTTYENCWAMKAGYLKNGSIAPNGNGNGFKMGGSDDKTKKHNVILKNCLAFQNKAKGFDQNSNKGDMTLNNCTAFDNGGYNFSIATSPLATGKTATVTNGVYYLGSNNLGSFVVQTTNSWQGFSVSSADFVSIDPSAAYGPRKADGSLPDIDFMHLATGSDLIDGGTDVGLPYNGSAPDLGCFEWTEPSTDITPPEPDPMTFATAPYAASSTSIAMVASTATDTENGVEYYFTCTAGGGHSSSWQSSTSYTDTGLTPSTMYTYTVTARDTSSNHNVTAASGQASATTDADTTAPTPNPMTFATAPYAASSSSISMVASTATDDVYGVEYYFTCTAGGGNDSGWQSSRNYTDTGLTPSTSYTYTVKARDLSAAHNETAASGPASATTDADTTAPAAPTGLTAEVGYEVIELDWDENGEPDLAGYNVYRWTDSDANHIKLNSSLLAEAYYDDNDVDYDTIYYYVVTAVDIYSNESQDSSQASAALQIYGDFIVNGVVDINDFWYLCQLWLVDDCNATAGVDIDDDCMVNFYEFSAFANNWRAVQPDTTPPAIPTGLSAIAGDGTVSLNWNDNNEADLAGYDVYRSETSGSGYVRQNVLLLTSSDYTDNSVVNGTTYYYVVKAVDISSNESDYSAEASATPAAPVTSITIQENNTNTDGYCGEDGSIDTDHSGYTGIGFVNTDNAVGKGIDYSIEILTAGQYAFTWRYANGSSDRPGNLIVNGSTEVSAISFPPTTGGWDGWETITPVNVTLTVGVKTVRLEATSSGGLANIDYIQITGPNLTTASCP